MLTDDERCAVFRAPDGPWASDESGVASSNQDVPGLRAPFTRMGVQLSLTHSRVGALEVGGPMLRADLRKAQDVCVCMQ